MIPVPYNVYVFIKIVVGLSWIYFIYGFIYGYVEYILKNPKHGTRIKSVKYVGNNTKVEYEDY